MTLAKWRASLVLFGLGLAGAAGVSLGGGPAVPTVVPTRIPPADAAPEANLVPVQYAEPAPRPEPSVALDWVGAPTMRKGRHADYALLVKNTCGQTVQKVVVQVKVPVVVGVVKTIPAAQVVEGVQLWELGSLAAGQSKELKLTLDPTAATDEPCQAWVTFTGTAGLTIKVEEAKVTAKLSCPATARVGEPVDFEVELRSVGTCAAETVTYAVRDESGREVARGAAPSTFGVDRNPHVMPRAGHALVKRGPAKFTLVVSSPDLAKPVTATCECVGVAPELVVKLDAPAEHPVGKPATCRATVTNVGDAPADGCDCRVSQAGGWTLAPQPPEPSRHLMPGEQFAVTFAGHAERAGASRLEVVATAGAKSAPVSAAATTRVVGYPALRVELLDTVDPVPKGAETVYEVRVTNTGTMADGQIVLSCPIPEQLEFVKADGPTPAKVETLNDLTVVRFEPVRELAPQTAMTFRIVARARRAGDVRFQARLTSEHLTSSVTKEESTRVYGE